MIIVVIIMSLLYFFYPANDHNFYPGCALYSLTGFYCPACGSQRAFSALLHGNIILALRNNLLFVLLIPVLIRLTFTGSRNVILNQKPYLKIKLTSLQLWTILGIILLFFILRNINTFPFNLLTPISPLQGVGGLHPFHFVLHEAGF